MTLETFKSNARKFRRCEIIAFSIGILSLFLAVIPSSYIEDRVSQVGFDSTCIAVTAISFPILVAVMFYGGVRFPQQSLRKLDLACPTCGKPLINRRIFRPFDSVITNGRCRFCGEKVIDSNHVV